jgi:hypothetical protein
MRKEYTTAVYLVSILILLSNSILLFNKVVLKLRKQFTDPETKALLTYPLFLVIYTYLRSLDQEIDYASALISFRYLINFLV